jgi:hypothetical protein
VSEPHDPATSEAGAPTADASVAHGDADVGQQSAAIGAPVAVLERRGPTVWVPAARAAVVAALDAGDATVIDTPDGAEYVVVSTRLPRHRIAEYTELAMREQHPPIVLVHPGGEALAIEALRLGCRMAIAEGDIDAILALGAGPDAERSVIDDSDDEPEDRGSALLDAFEARLSRNQVSARVPVSLVDVASGLPASGALQARLATITPDDAIDLRVMCVCIAALGERLRTRLGPDAHAILHRRLALGLKLLCSGVGDLFDMGDGSFVLLAHGLDVETAERLGRRMADMVEGYMPDGHLPLSVAVGHAGPECSQDAGTLRELAARAEHAALQEERSAVLGAGELVRSLATTTELEVTMRLADMVVGGPAGDDVAAAAVAVAARLGFEGRERLLVRFCATVAGVGQVLAAEPEQQRAAAAALVGGVAGPTAQGIIAALDERWDGGGPAGLAGADIPMAARIIAVARQVLVDGNSTHGAEAESGTRFDPTVVQAAADVLKGAA